jgi:hypothetical protein
MVIVRRHWNGNVSAAVDANCVYSLHMRDDPGGICGAFARSFLVLLGAENQADGGTIAAEGA